jgi:hypothetical protein
MDDARNVKQGTCTLTKRGEVSQEIFHQIFGEFSKKIEDCAAQPQEDALRSIAAPFVLLV